MRPETASSAWPCAARCCAGRWLAATPATGSCASPTQRPSWPRRRSSWRRCFRCWRADGTRDGIPDALVQPHVRPAVGAHFDDAREPACERSLEREAKSGEVLDTLVRQPVQRRGGGEVEPRGGGYVLRVEVPGERHLRPRDGQEVEDPAATVVEQHDRRLQPVALCRE